MKAPRFSSRNHALASSLALAIGASALAGPGPQYWQQMEKTRTDNADRNRAAVVASHASAAMTCGACRTSDVVEFSLTNVSGKLAPRSVTVGRKDSCNACGGAITTVRARTTNTMTANCPICANAGPDCCTK